MAAVVATMVVGPLLSVVKEKASSYLLEQYKVMKGMEEQHEILKRKLPAILDIITDAEQAAAHREGVAAWLGAIKKVTYQANEVFDEFKYEALRRQAKKNGQYNELGFDVIKLFPTHNRLVFRHRMGRKLRKIVQAIEVLVTEMNAFGFKYQQQPLISKQLRETDHVIFDPQNITSRSRDKDKRIIVDMLVGPANSADLTVVPIVGMGGLGKTTLAQLVYSDPKIKKHFNFLLWVCVSDGFDVDSLVKRIVEADSKKDDGTQEALEEKDYGTEAAVEKKNDGRDAAASFMKTPLDNRQSVVSRQRYLLVLDDVWKRDVDKWEQFKARLQHGGKDCVVLTTTRDEGVAEIMGTGEAYNLTDLDDEFIKEIIETRAFGYLHKQEKRPDWSVGMVAEIVKRCVGSPLAATALGSILRTKTSEEEWNALSSRSNICTEVSGILPILKLSYNDLPSHMKQCFAFCAIFPKGYEIDVDKLIQLWIAHGFIIHEKQIRLETTGKQIFSDLVSRSFFQDVKQAQPTPAEIKSTGACKSRTTCKIHDLMHDVALSVMEEECALGTEEPSQNEWLLNTARHLLLSCKEPAKKLNSSLAKSSPTIQTLLCDSDMGSSSLQHLSKYSSLQALQLRAGRSFPLKPKHLHHLRYLDLSRSSITSLPEDMSILYNLQTLNLSGCIYLGGLPRQMKYMTALLHLYTHGCPELKSMPRDLRKLTSLQTLTCFVAGSGSDCSNVGELGNLNLGGQLELRQLENVTEEDAKAANLLKKKELRELELRWTFGSENVVEETSCRDDARVLENLKPHDGLYALSIYACRAITFPAMFQNIVVIHIFDCTKLQWFFSCNSKTSFAFTKLKELVLCNLVCLERFWGGGMQGEEVMFPQLEILAIRLCGKLTALPGHPTFPNLKLLVIRGCPELTATAKSPKLGSLIMEGCEVELLLWVARHVTSLTRLDLISLEDSTESTLAADERSFRGVVEGKQKGNDHDFPLKRLVLTNFKSCVTGLFACFVHLRTLKIVRCHALVHWPEKEFEGLVSLRMLEITDCHNLSGYAQGLAEPSRSSETRQLLPCLELLKISSCEMLVEVFNLPTSVRLVDIRHCSKLESTSGRRLQQGQSASSIHQGASSISEVSSSSPGAMMEHLTLWGCHGLTGALHLPLSLKVLQINQCSALTSLESCSGELPTLQRLVLLKCGTLSSLPDGPQAYSSLRHLVIRDCPGMKTLPASLHQQLGSIPYEAIDAHYYEDTPRPMPSVKITEL